MPRELDFENLRICIDNYTPSHLFIRLTGSSGGTVKVRENLEGKKLDFKKNKSGLYFLVDAKEIFHFPLKEIGTREKDGFSLAYERIKPTEDGIGRIIMLPTGINPYDANLPEPRKSILRHALDDHLLEISFNGRIDVRPHSWYIRPHTLYWTVTKPLD